MDINGDFVSALLSLFLSVCCPTLLLQHFCRHAYLRESTVVEKKHARARSERQREREREKEREKRLPSQCRKSIQFDDINNNK